MNHDQKLTISTVKLLLLLACSGRAPTAATAPPKDTGMKLGKGGQKAHQFLESLKAEGEMIVEDVPPTLSKSKAAAAPPTDPITLTVEEKLNVTLKRDGGLSNFDVQGTLSLQILEEKDAFIQVQVLCFLATCTPFLKLLQQIFSTCVMLLMHPTISRGYESIDIKKLMML